MRFTSFQAGMIAANGVLGKGCSVLSNPKHMVPSLVETGARLFVTRFLSHFISTGCVILLEEGGTMFTFEGTSNKCSLKTVIRVHNPHFYWKVLTEADLGLADAYINEDFSFVDKNDGLLNLIMILIANRDFISSNSKLSKKRGWWTPLLFTAGLTSAKNFFKHALRQNTLTQARRNISRHYDLSNDLFSLFLDETMTYSCAVFKTEDEDLKDAQQRKISLLIEKVSPVSNNFCKNCSVEHAENIGLHYYQTLRHWRKNFLEKQSKILALEFNEKFIRTWEYYFDYCAAGFKSNTLGNYQIVFSRPGNVAALGNPYKGFPSAS
ncbi:uncharacterized protein LOC111279604 isoform X4 [Durio zibethinus]|uniref:Uncharacterized protein LOC111279604 isoform X4 n=1 Tax=Durio zibethinus TaxID=66656 RepID=A0A6P5X389_DURZI|nr:uncharacterized protein LOC111279604 isoform X4 [Durio zibethinus]